MKSPQKIEIGGVCCSIDFEDGFYDTEFKEIMSVLGRRGFSSTGNADISISVQARPHPAPRKLPKTTLYHSLIYDSINVTLLIDTITFEGQIAFSATKTDPLTPVRMWEVIETFIFNAYVFYFAINRTGIFIHSCGVEDGKGGYIFAGPSGAGKSTIARLSFPRTILSDDLVLLKKETNGERVLFGTPFGGDFGSINKSSSCQAIFFIEKNDTNEILSMKKLGAVAELMKEGINGNFMSHEVVIRIFPYLKFFQLISDLLHNIPCYNLKFTKEKSFWRDINAIS